MKTKNKKVALVTLIFYVSYFSSLSYGRDAETRDSSGFDSNYKNNVIEVASAYVPYDGEGASKYEEYDPKKASKYEKYDPLESSDHKYKAELSSGNYENYKDHRIDGFNGHQELKELGYTINKKTQTDLENYEKNNSEILRSKKYNNGNDFREQALSITGNQKLESNKSYQNKTTKYRDENKVTLSNESNLNYNNSGSTGYNKSFEDRGLSVSGNQKSENINFYQNETMGGGLYSYGEKSMATKNESVRSNDKKQNKVSAHGFSGVSESNNHIDASLDNDENQEKIANEIAKSKTKDYGKTSSTFAFCLILANSFSPLVVIKDKECLKSIAKTCSIVNMTPSPIQCQMFPTWTY